MITKGYRKKKKTPEEIAQERLSMSYDESMSSNDEDGMNSVNLMSVYNTMSQKNPPIMLLDGYNVLFKVMNKNYKIYKNKSLEQCRRELESQLITFSSYKGVKLAIAYDAMGYDNEYHIGIINNNY